MVVIRFGHDYVRPSYGVRAFTVLTVRLQDPQCMVMDDTLYRISEKVKNFAMIWKVDITQVPDFTKVGDLGLLPVGLALSLALTPQMYELYDP